MSYEIYLKIRYDSPYAKLSHKLYREQFFSYCNNYSDLIIFEGKIEEETIENIRSEFDLNDEIHYSNNDSSLVNYLILDCVCETNFSLVTDIIQQNHGIEISPVQFRDGWEYHKFICINRKIISNILRVLRLKFEVEVISIQEEQYYGPLGLYGISAKQLLNNLTPGQISILSEAYQRGYYEIPRKIRLNDIADKHGITRYAIESRLRRGENSIMDLIIPFLTIEAENN